MKEFVVYTGLRLLMFVATFAVVVGLWLLIAGEANIFAAVLIGFLVSGIGSYFLLNAQREAFARRVDERARRVTHAFDEARAKEDAD
jgi:multisubunit Na+/H+ antiporter MnhE subunit